MVLFISMEVLFSFLTPGQSDDLTLDHTHQCSLSRAASLEGWCCSYQKTKLEDPAAC